MPNEPSAGQPSNIQLKAGPIQVFAARTTEAVGGKLGLSEAMTGVGTADSLRKELCGTAGRMLQAFHSGRFREQFAEEYARWRNAGKIKNDYEDTEQAVDCLGDLVLALENDMPDSKRMDTLKKIFLVAATETLSDRNNPLPHLYMRLVATMAGGEILAMEAASRAATKIVPPQARSLWCQRIAQQSTLKHEALVNIHWEALVKHGIFLSTGKPERPRFAFSTLAEDLCKFIQEYEAVRPS